MKAKFTLVSILMVLFFISSGTNAFGQKFIKPVLRSLFLNQNVYKTIDELEVRKVYNHKSKEVINDTTKYIISPSAGNFLRYREINEDESIIRISPLVKFVKSQGDKYTIEFKTEDETPTITENPSDYYFKIVDEHTTPAKKFLATERLTAIPITIPLKYRFNAYDTDSKFTFDANIAYGFGYKIRIHPSPYKERYIRPLFAVGIGLQEYMPRDAVNTDYEPENELTFTHSFGVAYEGGSNFNIGLFLGWDRMFGDKKDWYYQSRSWLGVGIGYKFD